MTDTVRYDRQLRLWGEEGQAALERAHVCLIHGNAAGTETLKNLVLPGIGAFTVVDHKKVEPSDLGSNFFVTSSSLGAPRGQVVTELLLEMNDRVRGFHRDEDPAHLIRENIKFFDDFSLVIASSLREGPLVHLAEHLYQRGIPLVVLRTNGYWGYLRIAVPEHPIIQSKPDNVVEDLRIANVFPELQQFCDRFELNKNDAFAYNHIPFLVLLVKFVEKWKHEHQGQGCKNYNEKDEFKRLIMDSKISLESENFDEAFANAWKAHSPVQIPSSVKTILNDARAKSENLTKDSSNFWILVNALADFVNEFATLPLAGNLPDMVSTTAHFVELQRIFSNKAAQDMAYISAKVDASLTRLGRPNSIAEEEIRTFCKNTAYIRCLRYRSLQQEHDPASAKKAAIASALEDPASNIALYLLFRAAEIFQEKNLRSPGLFSGDVEADIPVVKRIVNSLLEDLGLAAGLVKDDAVHELCRYGGSELHNIASFMGGVTSLEVIKLITHQYVPVNNTYIYNGANSSVEQREL